MKIILLLSFLVPTFCWSQTVELLPSIGLADLPMDDEPMCEIIPIGGGTGNQHVIPSAGDLMADFTLYDLDANAYNLEDELNSNDKAILLVSGSFTCPKFTGSISVLNAVKAQYADEVSVLVIYTVEAHPEAPDFSPYSGQVWAGQGSNGQPYPQPTTYGDRKAIVSDLLDTENITVPVLLDGPCNEWWNYYTNNPNNAILIDQTGHIFAMHKEFDDFYYNNQPANIFCDIDSLLGLPTNCGDNAIDGFFQYTNDGSPAVTGQAGQTIFAYGEVTNTSDADVFLEIIRIINNVPDSWSTQMCTSQACYDPVVDTGYLYLEPGESSEYIMYFNTTDEVVPDTGRVRIGFRNINNFSNNHIQNFRCITYASVTPTVEVYVPKNSLQISPNPIEENAIVSFENAANESFEWKIYNTEGKVVQSNGLIRGQQIEFLRGSLNSGIYFLELKNKERKMVGKIILK